MSYVMIIFNFEIEKDRRIHGSGLHYDKSRNISRSDLSITTKNYTVINFPTTEQEVGH
jgi:hypothetical protein